MQRTVIAPVDLDCKAEHVVHCASGLARLHRAGLIVTHVVDHYSAESGYAPFASAGEIREDMTRTARGWLVGLLHHLGIHGAEIVVTAGDLRDGVATLAGQRHACYIVTGQSRWGVLGKLAGLHQEPRIARLGCDVIAAGAAGWAIDWGRALSLPG